MYMLRTMCGGYGLTTWYNALIRAEMLLILKGLCTSAESFEFSSDYEQCKSTMLIQPWTRASDQPWKGLIPGHDMTDESTNKQAMLNLQPSAVTARACMDIGNCISTAVPCMVGMGWVPRCGRSHFVLISGRAHCQKRHHTKYWWHRVCKRLVCLRECKIDRVCS